MYDDRNYMIFNVSELDSIDFDTVLETSVDTVRKSIDGSLTFVKWDGEIPECVNNLTTKQGPYSHNEILDILSGDSWNSPTIEPVQ
jgi:hypothetical protein